MLYVGWVGGATNTQSLTDRLRARVPPIGFRLIRTIAWPKCPKEFSSCRFVRKDMGLNNSHLLLHQLIRKVGATFWVDGRLLRCEKSLYSSLTRKVVRGFRIQNPRSSRNI